MINYVLKGQNRKEKKVVVLDWLPTKTKKSALPVTDKKINFVTKILLS